MFRQKLALSEINVSLHVKRNIIVLQILGNLAKLSTNLEISFQVLFKAGEENTTTQKIREIGKDVEREEPGGSSDAKPSLYPVSS